MLDLYSIGFTIIYFIYNGLFRYHWELLRDNIINNSFSLEEIIIV